jgi:hypothetical protein
MNNDEGCILGSFTVATMYSSLHNAEYNVEYKITIDVTGGTCSIHRDIGNSYKILARKPEHFGVLRLDER